MAGVHTQRDSFLNSKIVPEQHTYVAIIHEVMNNVV